MSEQIISYGGTMERSVDGTAWVAIPEALGIQVPTVETEYKDITSLDSPGGFREWLPGLKDGGVITVPAGYTADGYQQQVTDNLSQDPIYYRATLKPQPSQTTGDIFVFRGFPTAEVVPNDLGDPIKMNIKIRTTGALTWTAGA